jgi:hypothetical protein
MIAGMITDTFAEPALVNTTLIPRVKLAPPPYRDKALLLLRQDSSKDLRSSPDKWGIPHRDSFGFVISVSSANPIL